METPAFHASVATSFGYGGLGASSPPDEAAWKAYLTAVATRYQGEGLRYQVWNEANVIGFWVGTPAQMASLARTAFETIKAGEGDAFADLLYQALANEPEMPGLRVVPGAVGRNALAIGSTKNKPAAAAYVKAFTETVVKSGFVARSIEKAGVRGAAPPTM